METDDLFHTLSRRVREFSETQVRLYRHDPRLQQYFMQLQLETLTNAGIGSGKKSLVKPRFIVPVRAVSELTGLFRRRKYKADVLFCPAPYFDRKTENRLTVRTLLALANAGATILCLVPNGEPLRNELDAQLAAAGRATQVEFLDPTASSNPIETRLRISSARDRAWSTLKEIGDVLEPHGLRFGRDSQSGFEHIAAYIDAWERLAPSVEFEIAVVRCHWNTLCSAVCQTAMQRGKQTITFQQGIIGHTLDVPVTATKYVAFGRSSASFIEKVNHRFFQSAERPEPPVEYLPGGCMIDDIHPLPNNVDLKTLLMVDVQVNPGDFYGITSQCQALLQLAERLLSAGGPLRRLIIRPHPYWSDLELESIQRLARAHADRCEISHPAWSLEDDLCRSSAAIGIFSGVLTVASASGLPTYFLRTQNGFTTEDLACFSAQTLLPEDAFREIGSILSDRGAYANARRIALENAREYYANGKNLDFSPAFFERLLGKETSSTVERGVQ
jgi:hypothetical protein